MQAKNFLTNRIADPLKPSEMMDESAIGANICLSLISMIAVYVKNKHTKIGAHATIVNKSNDSPSD